MEQSIAIHPSGSETGSSKGKKPSEPTIFIGALTAVLEEEIQRQRGKKPPSAYQDLMTQMLSRVDTKMEAVAAQEYKDSDYLLPCCISMFTKVLEIPVIA